MDFLGKHLAERLRQLRGQRCIDLGRHIECLRRNGSGQIQTAAQVFESSVDAVIGKDAAHTHGGMLVADESQIEKPEIPPPILVLMQYLLDILSEGAVAEVAIRIV